MFKAPIDSDSDEEDQGMFRSGTFKTSIDGSQACHLSQPLNSWIHWQGIAPSSTEPTVPGANPAQKPQAAAPPTGPGGFPAQDTPAAAAAAAGGGVQQPEPGTGGPMQRIFGIWSRSNSGSSRDGGPRQSATGPSSNFAAAHPFGTSSAAAAAGVPAAAAAPTAAAPAAAAGVGQGAQHCMPLQQWTRRSNQPTSSSPEAAAAAAANNGKSSLRPAAGKRRWPFNASAAGAAASSPANVSAAAAAAAAAAASGGTSDACVFDTVAPSAPPLSCLIAEQEQEQKLKRQHVMQQQQHSPAAASGGNRHVGFCGAGQQRQQRQEQQLTHKRAAESDLQQQQQEAAGSAGEWHWPTSRSAAGAAAAGGSSAQGWCESTATQSSKKQQTGAPSAATVPSVGAFAFGASSVRLPAIKRHADGDLQAEAAKLQQEQQRQQGQSQIQGPGPAAAAGSKRLHAADAVVDAGAEQPAAAAAARAGADAATAAAALGGGVSTDDPIEISDTDTDMHEAGELATHLRRQPEGQDSPQQQQQQREETAAAVVGVQGLHVGAGHQQQQRPHKAARTSAGVGCFSQQTSHHHQQQQQQDDDAQPAGSLSCSRAALLSALQSCFPPLLTVLAAVQAGGLPAVLQGPSGPAAAALMARPAGRTLLHAFVDMAGNEPLLAAALAHYQSLQEQQQEELAGGLEAGGATLGSGSAAVSGRGNAAPGTPPGTSSEAAAEAARTAAEAVGSSPIFVRNPALGQALQQLQETVAEGEVAAAVQLLCSLSLVMELQQEGKDTTAVLQSTRQQLQQVTMELQQKLDLAEKQQQQQQQEQAMAAVAAAELRRTREQLEHALMCQICFEKPKDTVLMPCMHFLYCSGCLDAAKTPAKKSGRAGVGGSGSKGDGGLLKCPVCRVPCSGQLVVHLSAV